LDSDKKVDELINKSLSTKNKNLNNGEKSKNNSDKDNKMSLEKR
jgi:hypothetical protein